MCIMCEGGDRDDVLFDLHRRVLRFGWALQGVYGEAPPDSDWVYSIGLAGGFDHPELVILGDVGRGGPILNEIGELVRSGLRFEAGDSVTTSAGEVGLGQVHPDHIEAGLINLWVEYYGSIGPPFPPVGLLQVTPPGSGGCWHDQRSVPLLSDPATVWHADPPVRPNRAERRARARRR